MSGAEEPAAGAPACPSVGANSDAVARAAVVLVESHTTPARDHTHGTGTGFGTGAGFGVGGEAFVGAGDKAGVEQGVDADVDAPTAGVDAPTAGVDTLLALLLALMAESMMASMR
mmetsp:Transcript_14541/g.38920  ORF Transcript_14541/g.38920 Transcript_14541/m.38920 type:complete len:115 (+) Transcript_14541:246-590(+)